MMLDRGHSLDWFASAEIVAEAVVAGLAFYMFVVHMLTAKRPFLEPAMFADRNFTVSLLMIFVVGTVLLATVALLPPFLQNLLGYPVLETGHLLAPRGIGTMLGMMAIGRLVRRVDIRVLLVVGLLLTAFSLWEMTRFNLDVPASTIVLTGFIQGIGLGFLFVPLSTSAFASLAQHYRNEGTALFSLVRNIGSSIGISVVITLLAREMQRNHAILGEHLSPFAFSLPSLPPELSPATAQGLALLNAEVTRQAAMIAYLQDFRLMMWVTLAALPMVLLLRRPARPPALEEERAAIE
jgi:DHA2 family multidrug resistance protein